MTGPLRVATRGSALARWQAERIVALLARPAELVVVSTLGDRDTASTIHSLGGTGVFVKEVQDAVLRGDADLAVHSAKDLPPIAPEGLTFAAVPERADPRDALVGSRLDDLPTGARIGTGSVRRRAQLASFRPDFTFGELRGNIPTRLERAVELRRDRRGGGRARPARPGRASDGATRAVGPAPAGGPGRARGRVPRRTTTTRLPLWPRSTTRPRTRRSGPSARSSRASVVVAACRAVRSPGPRQTDRSYSRRSSRRSTVASCCAWAAPGPTRRRSVSRSRASCSTSRAAA